MHERYRLLDTATGRVHALDANIDNSNGQPLARRHRQHGLDPETLAKFVDAAVRQFDDAERQQFFHRARRDAGSVRHAHEQQRQRLARHP